MDIDLGQQSGVSLHLSILNPLKAAALGVYIAVLRFLIKGTCSFVGLSQAFLYYSLVKGIGVFEGLFFILDYCIQHQYVDFCGLFIDLLYIAIFPQTLFLAVG